MGARHTHAAGIQPADVAQKHAALQCGDAAGVGLLQLRVIAVNGGRVDDHVGPQHVFSLVAHVHGDAKGALRVDDGALVHIAAGDLVAFGVQNLHQGIHAAAADADKMQALYAV